jgi:hypothetical protein
MRRIFGRKEEEISKWIKLHRGFYSSPNIIRIIKLRRIRWVRHVAHLGE